MALSLKPPGASVSLVNSTLPPAREGTDEPASVLLYGAAGAGKTRAIAALLLRSHVVLMLHFGSGPTGVKTIRSYLFKYLNSKEAVDACLHAQFRHIRITETSQAVAIAEQGWEALKGPVDTEFLTNVTHIAIEEINTLQARYEYNLTPKKDGIPKITMTRKANDEASGSMGHFGDLKMGTEWVFEKLLLLQPPDRFLCHVWTAHEGTIKVRKESGETGPALQTRAVLSVTGAFDFIIQCVHKPGMLNSPSTYLYNLRTAEAITKVRGEDWPTTMPADPDLLWDAIEEKITPAELGSGESPRPASTPVNQSNILNKLKKA